MTAPKWILLLYELPTAKSSQRVNLWRRLKKIWRAFAQNFRLSAAGYSSTFREVPMVAQQIRDGGGDATLIRVSEIENLNSEAVTALFKEARAADYQDLIASLNELLKQNRKRKTELFSAGVEKFRARFAELRVIDFFDSPRAHDVETLLQKAENLHAEKISAAPRLSAKDYSGKTWLTRPRLEIDRVGSAWLIQKFVDPKATFVFAASPAKYPKAIPYDMLDVELTHHGEDCTFETLLKRFAIDDKGAQIIGEMLHDADLEDDKFHRQECLGFQRMFIGWGLLGFGDDEILEKGIACFDALHASVRKRRER